jgi:ADP-heptose:LPS heptosyltransferase
LNKILVIQTASIGDVILATAVIEKLHLFYTGAAIDLLVKKGNESLFTGHPFLNQVITWNKKERKLLNFEKILLDVRKNRYDAVINIQRFGLTGLLTAFSGSKKRIGFSKNPFSVFFSDSIRHEIRGNIHEVDRNQSLVSALTDNSPAKPKLYPTEKDFEKVSEFIQKVYCTISPGSLWATKQYPEARWTEFVNKTDPALKVILLGSKDDREMCERIIRNSDHENSLNLAGELTLLESAALMRDAVMNFTNDSAPMHLASAMNAPVTVIYCSTVPGFGFGPLSDNSGIVEIREKLYCRPCGLHGLKSCPEKHFRCAHDIATEQILKHL